MNVEKFSKKTGYQSWTFRENENPALLDDPELDESEKPEYPKPLLFILNQWLFKKEN